jgi:hypothetical protein
MNEPHSRSKKRYLVVYDYGTGGLWGVIEARSETEILSEYPELKIVSRPAWMSEERFRTLEVHDIDGAPWGILNAVLDDRYR